MKHTWELDICKNCGLKRSNKVIYTKDLRMKRIVSHYLINDKWVITRPECVGKKEY